MSIGFTGTSKRLPTFSEARRLEVRLRELFLLGHTDFHHGDCLMMDEFAAKLASKIGYRIYCHPPIQAVKRAFAQSHVMYGPKPYLERNHDIVNAVERLLAMPNETEEIVRSGTWATIRYARKRHVPFEILTDRKGLF
jgi:hypothetical protein